MVQARQFRQDLFFRLNVIPLRVPPLRDRPEDIPELAMQFARSASAANGRVCIELASDAIELLREQDWPGNVRELEHFMERLVVFCEGRVVERGDILASVRIRGDPHERFCATRRAGTGCGTRCDCRGPEERPQQSLLGGQTSGCESPHVVQQARGSGRDGSGAHGSDQRPGSLTEARSSTDEEVQPQHRQGIETSEGPTNPSPHRAGKRCEMARSECETRETAPDFPVEEVDRWAR